MCEVYITVPLANSLMHTYVIFVWQCLSLVVQGAYKCNVCMAVPLPSSTRCIQMQCLYGSASPLFFDVHTNTMFVW